MNNADIRNQNGSINHRQETVWDRCKRTIFGLLRIFHIQGCTPSQPCTVRGLTDIHPREFLPVVKRFLPASYELFSKVVEDRELWEEFRQRAAEAFCKENKACFLNKTPLSPFYFAHIEGAMKYHGPHPTRYVPDISYYTLADLAVIAENVVEAFS